MKKLRAKIFFLRWLSKAHPDLYAQHVKRALPVALGSLGWVEALINAVAQVGSAVLSKKQADKAASLQKAALKDAQAQRDAEPKAALLSTNYQRAQAGLPPVDLNGRVIPASALPMPEELTGPSANTALVAAGKNVSAYLPWIAGGAGLLVIFFFLRSRK